MPTPEIHPTAIVDARAEIEPGVHIGPHCIIEAGVTIEAGTRLGPLVHVQGETHIGPDNEIHTGVTLGFPPQHLEYDGAPTRLTIGRANQIREYVSIHRAYEADQATTIGDECYLMGFCHVGHDCSLGDGVIIANGALLSGHVAVGDRAFISGNCIIHQFCRIGRLVMMQGGSGLGQDVPPFTLASGLPACLRTLNTVGLRRAGITAESRRELKRLFKALYLAGEAPRRAAAAVDREGLGAEAIEFLDFFAEPGPRGYLPYASYKRTGGKD